MTYRRLQLFTILLPTLLIGGFEYIRHDCLLNVMSMETGNLFITLLTLVLTFLYVNWMFRKINRMNNRLSEERARRAVYEERERMARELHDGIAQTLFFLNVKLKKGQIEEARTAVAAIDNHVRQSIFNLRSLPEEAGTLSLRLQKWLNEWSALTGIEVTTSFRDLPDQFFSPTADVQLFGIVQEAFNNIRKHSGARSAELLLHAAPDGSWQLRITDDGQGIDKCEINPKKYGLSMMVERAKKLHADFSINKREPRGTELIMNGKPGGKRR